MAKSGNTAMEHMVKQKKRKNLSDEYVYGSQGGSVELHKLFNYKVGNEKLGLIIAKLIEENETLNTRLDNAKTALTTMLNRIEIIERKMKTYGLE